MNVANMCASLIGWIARLYCLHALSRAVPLKRLRCPSARRLGWAALLGSLLLGGGAAFSGVPSPAQGSGETQLGYWTFSDTNWLSQFNFPPSSFTNISNVPGGDGNTLLINSTNPAWLIYNVVENDNTTNLSLDYGGLAFWFSPQWSSTNAGGCGPGCWAPLIQVGQYSAEANYGLWTLCTDPEGANIGFFAQDGNGFEASFLTAPICWMNGDWHYIALSYSYANSTLFIDGLAVTNGSPVTRQPGPQVIAEGFCVGSSPDGIAQARGRFDDLSTYNYPVGWGEVAGEFEVRGLVYFGAPPPLATGRIISAPAGSTRNPTYSAVAGAGCLATLR